MSEALTAPDFSTIPVGPLALIALPGCEELAAKIDAYLKTWREIRESEHKTTIAFSGYQRDSYLIKAAFPRFGSGESKCHIQQSVRGYDIFIVCDMFNYGLTYIGVNPYWQYIIKGGIIIFAVALDSLKYARKK